ncbi:MAG: alpha/beta hydrolase [Verrucomicrobia bacterium]|jgi:pimeloyl-ACP methyl ester carboxylesterase|nr:alpha/beta hydrolase [Verrucomicrobiota bacterium]
MHSAEVRIPLREVTLGGKLIVPPGANGLVIFAHGSGSSRHSPRNQFVADVLRAANLGTLLFDLLTEEEERAESHTCHLRFNIPLLAGRLVAVTRWALKQTVCDRLRVGYFGASTGAAAALEAAAELGQTIGAVVSRGGRPDLAATALARVTAPTLFIVGAFDTPVIPLNESAYAQLRCEKALAAVPGASHLFEESGTLEIAADLAAKWLVRHLAGNAY